MIMALFQKPHDPADLIKQGLKDGYQPSTRTMLNLGPNLCTHMRDNGIKTVRDLAMLRKETLYEILSKRENPPEDLATIENALAEVGLKLGMTRDEFKRYKKASQP